MIWLLPHPLPPSPVSKMFLFVSLPDGRVGGRKWGGVKSYDHENARSSINHSILSAVLPLFFGHVYLSNSFCSYFISFVSARLFAKCIARNDE